MILGTNLPNIPWQDRPAGCTDPVWRYDRNPIVGRHDIPSANSIFNSAVIPKDGAFVGVFRSDNKAMEQQLFLGKSEDALHWDIEHEPLKLYCEKTGECVGLAYGYDPRVCFLEDRYYVTWCSPFEQHYGPTIGVAYSYDFKTFYRLPDAYLPYNRNGVLSTTIHRPVSSDSSDTTAPAQRFPATSRDQFAKGAAPELPVMTG